MSETSVILSDWWLGLPEAEPVLNLAGRRQFVWLDFHDEAPRFEFDEPEHTPAFYEDHPPIVVEPFSEPDIPGTSLFTPDNPAPLRPVEKPILEWLDQEQELSGVAANSDAWPGTPSPYPTWLRPFNNDSTDHETQQVGGASSSHNHEANAPALVLLHDGLTLIV